jgi:Tfp pilus assembly protein PilP
MKKSIRNMAVICITVGSLTLGSSFAVFAADTSASTTTTTTTTTSQCQNYKNGQGRMQGIDVTTLVKDGIIDQTTADSITAYISELQTEKKAEMDKVTSMTDTEKKAYFESIKSNTKTSLLDQLVSKEIITQAQEDAIKAAMPQTNQSKMGWNKAKSGTRMNKLDTSTLVKDGVIDQTTADAITAYVTKIETDQKAEMDKVKSMTDTEKKAYFESKKSETKTSLLDQLVSNNIITSDQKTAIETKVSSQKTDTNKKSKFDVSSLVTKGVIDQATADAITTYMTQKETDMKAEMDKVKSMTDTEKKAYFESKKSETKTNLSDELVSKGIITQDQATAIKAAFTTKSATKSTTTKSATKSTAAKSAKHSTNKKSFNKNFSGVKSSK